MPIKLYLDEDVDPLLAQVLRSRGTDCLATREVNNLGISDSEQLAFAVSQGRAILTLNVEDFVQLAREWSESGRHHKGIIVSDHLPFATLLRRILAMLLRHEQGDLTDTFVWLQGYERTDAP